MAKKNKSTNSKPLVPWLVGGFFLWMMFKPKTASAGGGGTPGITTGGNGYTPTRGFNGSPDESYLGITPTSKNRGIRNNNPGNVKRGGSAWNGKIPFAQSTDQTFEQFEAYKYGVRVMIYLLRKYINEGDNTVDKIMRRYNPPGNQGYINYVTQKLGISGPYQIVFSDKTTLKKLVQAIARWENGQTATGTPEVVTDQQFETGWNIL